MNEKAIDEEVLYVTKPALPPLDELQPYLERIWQSAVLTNCGPLHQELEEALCEHLNVPHVALFTNGTIALLTALQTLGVSGEVITTPFSFVATSHALLWNGLKPIFVDIERGNLNLDPARVEEAITDDTTAILPVHCYGIPCDVESIDAIAKQHRLSVIYDAAHAFGVECHCGSLLNHGDLSVVSFHATKVFNTFEGGAIICKDEEVKKRIDFLKNFGHSGETTVLYPGINGKMSELHAAVGLTQLEHVESAISARKQVNEIYLQRLASLTGVDVSLNEPAVLKHNYAYFPVRVSKNARMSRDELYDLLKRQGVHPRKYFYPLISEHPMYRHLSTSDPSNLPEATLAAHEVLCLPIYPSLKHDDVHRICDIIHAAFHE